MPSESQASPVARQTKISTSTIEREDLGFAPLPCEKLSQADEDASQASSVSVSLNTEAHRMVDDLLDSEAAENESNAIEASESRSLLAPNIKLSAVGKTGITGIDTTYDFDTTIDASGFLRALHDYPAQKQLQDSPRPHLPSIYNSPFAPQAGEATPRSRPGTAKCMSPLHSRQTSQHTMLCSSMPDPSSFVSTQTPMIRNGHARHRDQAPAWDGGFGVTSHYGAIGDPILRANGNGGFHDDSEFRSSEVFTGSNWAYSGQAAHEAMNVQTPANGQGII